MNTSRRSFLKKSAIFAVPVIIPAAARGADGTVAPSNRITIATLGWGMQGPSNCFKMMERPGVEMLAVCDVDTHALEKGVADINGRAKSTNCKGHKDFREILARTDIDAINLSLPDNWHAYVAVEAAKAGKDIWGEKPLARTIKEQQAIVKAVTDAKRVWQTGSWQRSVDNFRVGAEIVRNGLIGRITEVHIGLPSGHNDFAKTGDKTMVSAPPAHLDYDMWVGPSQMEDYIEARIHKNWRWNYNIGAGQLIDWIGHHCDIAHWGLDLDETGGPVEVECTGDLPPRTDVWNTAKTYRSHITYHNGMKMIIAGGHKDISSGCKWIGTDGWVHVDRDGFDCSNPAWKKTIKSRTKEGNIVDKTIHIELPDDLRKIKLEKYESGHWGNFIDCIRSRARTITPVNVAHHSTIPGHLALIAMLKGRKIKWDPAQQTIIGDDDAATLLGREYRAPWKLV